MWEQAFSEKEIIAFDIQYSGMGCVIHKGGISMNILDKFVKAMNINDEDDYDDFDDDYLDDEDEELEDRKRFSRREEPKVVEPKVSPRRHQCVRLEREQTVPEKYACSSRQILMRLAISWMHFFQTGL